MYIHAYTNSASVSLYPSLALSRLLCFLLFSLLHFHSHQGSGGPPPQSIMVKSQSTAAHSGHCADKLVKEKRREAKRREENVETLEHLEEALEGGEVAHWVHCTVKEWARSTPGQDGNGWVSQCHWWSPCEAQPLVRELCLHTDVNVPLIFSPRAAAPASLCFLFPN